MSRFHRGTASRRARGEPPHFIFAGVGKRPLHVPEQLALQQGEGRARAQWTLTSGPLRRGLFSCSVRASSSLPVPLSPRTRTEASLLDTLRTVSRTSVIAGPCPTMAVRCNAVGRLVGGPVVRRDAVENALEHRDLPLLLDDLDRLRLQVVVEPRQVLVHAGTVEGDAGDPSQGIEERRIFRRVGHRVRLGPQRQEPRHLAVDLQPRHELRAEPADQRLLRRGRPGTRWNEAPFLSTRRTSSATVMLGGKSPLPTIAAEENRVRAWSHR